MSGVIAVVDLGLAPYVEVLELQRELCRRRVAGEERGDVLLLVEHEPVVTLGRSTLSTSLPLPRALLEARGLAVHEVERGGDVTLHAPGQLVGYPIFDLGGWHHDLHWYLRQLEAAVIGAVAEFGITAGRNSGKTGVWVDAASGKGPPGGEQRKIASIGIHVKRWVTLHGFALNVTNDLALFDLIVPCGIHGVTMTSVDRETGRTDAELGAEVRRAMVANLGRTFDREMVPGRLGDLAGVVTG